MPVHFSDQQRSEMIPEIKEIQCKIKDKLSIIQSKMYYLDIAKHSIFYDATEITVKYSFSQKDNEYD